MERRKTIGVFFICLVIFSMSEPVVPIAPLVVLGRIIPRLFTSIIGKARPKSPGKSFYSLKSLLEAAESVADFVGNTTRYEIAALFAHVNYETQHFSQIEEMNGTSRTYCKSSSQYPCATGKKYYGRGPLKLRWNYNYGEAGEALGLDLLKFPEILAEDAVESFKTALWYWITHVRPALEHGFGATIGIINPEECHGGNSTAVQERIGYFVNYCTMLGVDPGTNITC